MLNLSCAILAGGRGSRLFPLTYKKAKPAVLFGPGYRLIDIPISNAINSKVLDICVFAQYYPDLLEKHIEEAFFSQRIHPSKIQIFKPPIGQNGESILFQGTADALRKMKHHFENIKEDYILILSGDQLYTMDFEPFLKMAEDKNADLLIACLDVSEHDAKRMGVMKIDQDLKILDFHEKPKKKDDLDRLKNDQGRFLASMGIYIFKKQTLLSLLNENGDDFGKDLIPLQLKKGGVFAYPFNGYWEDIGTVESFFKANLALINEEKCLKLADEKFPLHSKLQVLAPPKIESCAIENSLVSQGTVLKADRVKNSIIGSGSVVEMGSELTNTLILGNTQKNEKTHIGPYCRLKNVIIDEGAKIGANVRLENFKNLKEYDGEGVYIRDGIMVVQAGANIPDGFIL
jgi:glucose-1-phosphate adenylyltransferase